MPKGPKGEKRPADVIGAADTLRDMEWIVSLIDERAPKPGRRGPYKKRNAGEVS